MQRCDDFIGLKLPGRLKKAAREVADQKGITLSELVRRKLKELRPEPNPQP